MNIFKNIFGENKSVAQQNKKEEVFYFTLNTIEQLNEIDEISFTKPVIIFKHSTRCIISRTVLKQFEKEYNFSKEKIQWYVLDLLNYRDISNEIAQKYTVTHQSPQIIVIQNGKAIFNESHENISVEILKQFT